MREHRLVIKALEEALIEYAVKYGVTDKARAAIRRSGQLPQSTTETVSSDPGQFQRAPPDNTRADNG